MIRKEIGLEQYYTPQSTANWVIQVIRDQPFWIDLVEFIEPTAGKGVFVDALKPYEHYATIHYGDLEPQREDIQKWDALQVNVPELPDGKSKEVRGCALLVTRHKALRF